MISIFAANGFSFHFHFKNLFLVQFIQENETTRLIVVNDAQTFNNVYI